MIHQMPRLTIINQFYPPDISPTAHLCASLAEHRARLGDDVTILTSRTGYVAPRGIEEASGAVRVRRLWSTRLGSRTNLRRLIDWTTFYLRATLAAALLPRQDVYIALTTPPFIVVTGVLHKLLHPSARLILWNMDCYPEAIERTGLARTGGFVARIMRAANRAVFRRLDQLVCLDEAMRDLLFSQYKPHHHELPCTIIPNWERADLFPHERVGQGAEHTQCKESRSLTDGGTGSPPVFRKSKTFVVLYLGNAGYGHEFQTTLDAADLLRDAPVTFLFVGGGALWPWIGNEVRRRGLSNVRMEGYIPKEQTPELMRAADCALITLENQMLGVMSPSKLHASLAMGLPALYVGPTGGNVDEAIERFACGFSVRPGDATKLADTIRELANDPDALMRLRRQARRAFETMYCDRQTLPKFDAVIEQMGGRHEARNMRGKDVKM